MRKAIGLFFLFLPFLVMFSISASATGLKETLIVFGGAILALVMIGASVAGGVYLLESEEKKFNKE